MALETAEEFALRLVQRVEPRWTTVANVKVMAPDIEADRDAVRREMLDEFVKRWADQPDSSQRPVLDTVDALRDKYATKNQEP